MNFICLNRTFYGIETVPLGEDFLTLYVLIVPFMELKHPSRVPDVVRLVILIVPFMELKLKSYVKSRPCFLVLIVPFMELKPLGGPSQFAGMCLS